MVCCDESSTTYDLGNGRRQTVLYTDPIRYRDKNGQLREYDPSLIPAEQEAQADG